MTEDGTHYELRIHCKSPSELGIAFGRFPLDVGDFLIAEVVAVEDDEARDLDAVETAAMRSGEEQIDSAAAGKATTISFRQLVLCERITDKMMVTVFHFAEDGAGLFIGPVMVDGEPHGGPYELTAVARRFLAGECSSDELPDSLDKLLVTEQVKGEDS